MATILFKSYAINEVTPYGVSINLHLAGDNPFPSERFEASKMGEIRAAFAEYVQRAQATGKPMQLSAMVLKGRKPNGFNSDDLTHNVNVNNLAAA